MTVRARWPALSLVVLLAFAGSFALAAMPPDGDVVPSGDPSPPGVPALPEPGSGGFTENLGQARPADVRFYRVSGPMHVGFGAGSVRLTVEGGGSGAAVRLAFPGSRDVGPEGEGPLPHRSHFFRGTAPAEGVTGVRSFEAVVYRDLWEGIDLRYRVSGDGVKYEYALDAGSRPGDVSVAYEGVDRLAVAADGSLAIAAGDVVLRDTPPVAFQGGRTVACAFRLAGRLAVGFSCPGWEPGRPGVIDPLVYATYLGHADRDDVRAVAVAPDGSAFAAGHAGSPNFPVTPGAFRTTHGGGSFDAYVAKFAPDGTSLAWATFLGGSDYDVALSIAVDGNGSAYVAGETHSTDFPTTPGALRQVGDGADAFVAKLGPDGDALSYSTFLGGSGPEAAFSLAVDPSGSAYVTGITGSPDFPTTPGAYNRTYAGFFDAFVAKLAPDGSGLAYGTFLGGPRTDSGNAIAVDAAGSAYVGGGTGSPIFPVTPGAFDTSYNDVGPFGGDAFVVKLVPSGGAVQYGTFLGGTGVERVNAVAVDAAGVLTVAGATDSPDFPVTVGAANATYGGNGDAFVVRLNAAGSALVWGTFLGSTAYEDAWGVALGPLGDVYVAGSTWSPGFPVTPDAVDRTHNGGSDAFVARLDATGSTIRNATFLGGARNDVSWGIARHPSGTVYVAGDTLSADFPTTPGAFDPSCGSDGDCDFDGIQYFLDGFLVALDFEGAVVDVTLRTIPPGLQVEVDGVPYAAPHTFPCAVGSTRTVGAPSPQVVGASRHTFADWSDGGARTHAVSCFGPLSLTARFSSEHEVVLDTSPPGLEIVVNGTAFTAPATFWWPEGSTHLLEVPSPQAGPAGVRFVFSSWSDGGARAHNVTVSAPRTIVASFASQFWTTLDTFPPAYVVSVGGTPYTAPHSFWCDAGALMDVDADPPPLANGTRATFTNWSDGGAKAHAIPCDGPGAHVATFLLEHRLLVDTTPPGRDVTVDTVPRAAPAAQWCEAGATVALGVPTPQVVGATRHLFLGWSDGSPRNHTWACAAPRSVVASFATEHNVVVDTSPPSLEVRIDGVTRTAPQAFWWPEGSFHSVDVATPQASGDTRHVFSSWSDGGGKFHSFAVTQPVVVTASFVTEHRVVIDASHPGIAIEVDGVRHGTPYAAWWAEGEPHDVAVASPQPGPPGTRYLFASWSDGGPRNRTVAATAPTSLTTSFLPQHRLTLLSPYGSPACDVPDCWYDEGTTASFSVEGLVADGPGVRRAFVRWAGVAGAGVPASTVVMDGPVTATAVWGTEYFLAVTTTFGAATGEGWYGEGETATFTLSPLQVASEGRTYRFRGWSGDVPASGAVGAVAMDGPKSVYATWEEVPQPSGAWVFLPLVAAVLILLVLFLLRRRRREEGEDGGPSPDLEDELDLDAGPER